MPNFAAFRAEVKKVFKADIPLADRSDWEDSINRDRAETLRLSAEITQAEARIESIVYDLFDLTEDEIALLDAAVQPLCRQNLFPVQHAARQQPSHAAR
ncbi:hypothetical protein AL035_19535 [Salipiger aestuarii]|uniref:Uncharacterized protein n=1 Tax=Salipiger aestuarii TaxID=568098 RepID=A0A327Y2C5_9RHOB|nr:hypothetical protein AL035_19535 [Salipiger aestuarii]RAK15163.1 hypothetical protein ATI53_102565 [Salipiger aestuarii]